jgi:L,D-peptidoglycan transpeptidase YkuD (ErfK/YbiS/YcfS/YnhG family)
MDFRQAPTPAAPLEDKAKAGPSALSLRRRRAGIYGRSLLLLGILPGALLLNAFLRPATAQVLRREAFALRNCTQMLVVITPEWNATFGTLRRYERSTPNEKWKAVGHPIAVVVGKNGLGWDTGAEVADPQEARNTNDPMKKDGDFRSPAGIFALGTTFGHAFQKPVTWRMPYLPLTPAVECVDDPKSKFYNQVLDRSAVSPDWKSSEPMFRTDDIYRWGLVVKQNVDPAQPGKGSCIFLHIWTGPGQATDGGTATAQEQMENLLAWLDPYQNPLLVQLPASKYDELQKTWELPAIP